MDPEYWDYFRERLNALREFVQPGVAAEEADPDTAAVQAVDSAVQTAGYELRPDAHLLLLLLAREFATLPVSTVRPEQRGEVASATREDVATIVGRASDLQQGGEISSHAIVDALSATWNELRTTSLHVWG
jgi:hypothetical protein